MSRLPSSAAQSTGAQRLPVHPRVKRVPVDRGADSGQPSAAADPEAGRSGPWSTPSQLRQGLRRGRAAIGAAGAAAVGLIAAEEAITPQEPLLLIAVARRRTRPCTASAESGMGGAVLPRLSPPSRAVTRTRIGGWIGENPCWKRVL